MHVRRLTIENLRSIRGLDFQVDAREAAGWHVFLGDNGAGKSTVVRSLALALMGAVNAHATRQDWARWVSEADKGGAAAVTLDAHPTDDWKTQGAKGKQPIVAKAQIRIADPASTNGRADLKFSGRSAERTVWGGGAGWFSASFGPSRRFSGTDPEMDRLYLTHPRLAPHLSAFGENVALGECLRWLTDLQFRSLEGDDDARRVRDAVKSFVNRADLLPHGASIREITAGRVVIEDGAGSCVAVEEMSDGYRSILSLTLEMLRLMFANFSTDVALRLMDEEAGTVRLPGVVAIDEIDAHLHPQWQQRIGDWFLSRFPETQFLVTTHSPIICRAARLGSVWLLPTPGTGDDPRRIEGTELARLLDGNILEAYGTDLFGEDVTRSPESEKKLARLAVLNRKRLLGSLPPDEQSELEQLRAAMPTAANHTAPVLD